VKFIIIIIFICIFHLQLNHFECLNTVADSMQWGRVSGGIKQDDPLPVGYIILFF